MVCADAGVVELADTQALGACGAIRVGSSPAARTSPRRRMASSRNAFKEFIS